MLLSQNAQVQDVSDGTLVLGFASPGARDNFGHGGSTDLLADAIIEVLGVELRIQGVVANERLAERGQRRAGAPVPEPETSRPAPAPPAPEPEPDYSQFSENDQKLDGSHNAEALLTKELAAEIISVDGDTPPDA